MTALVIYHAHCPDGFGAAWVAARALTSRFPIVELHPASYGEDPPYDRAKDACVYVVDFSYPRAQLERLWGECSELVVLDHHKTAQAELEGLPYCTFDMNRSGAGLTWDFFHPAEQRPWVIDYVEDRDLWRFQLPFSREVSLRIRLTPHTILAWDELASRTVADVMKEAAGAHLHLEHYVRDALRNAYMLYDVDGHDTAAVVVNVSYTGVSDVLNAALDEHGHADMAIGWQLHAQGHLQCSVRSREGFDCSVFAKSLGGGGHAQAAGFKCEVSSPMGYRLLGLDRARERAVMNAISRDMLGQ